MAFREAGTEADRRLVGGGVPPKAGGFVRKAMKMTLPYFFCNTVAAKVLCLIKRFVCAPDQAFERVSLFHFCNPEAYGQRSS